MWDKTKNRFQKVLKMDTMPTLDFKYTTTLHCISQTLLSGWLMLWRDLQTIFWMKKISHLFLFPPMYLVGLSSTITYRGGSWPLKSWLLGKYNWFLLILRILQLKTKVANEAPHIAPPPNSLARHCSRTGAFFPSKPWLASEIRFHTAPKKPLPANQPAMAEENQAPSHSTGNRRGGPELCNLTKV